MLGGWRVNAIFVAQAGAPFTVNLSVDRAANFNLPNRIFGSPGFGRIFSAKSPREMQFGIRFSF